ncbi:unnamed protein product [Vitrella brassicaformis CCMP3155]|uniref:L-dopachrome isomerase n=1 Tax=Vitrella brassicaformis (strain CCMP3155) TaxID=1169540 RepID=A0A0G4G6W1_VITBC|nr:unnamed protein product [Vitrella brassicaformis CCMP3155]|eukprot:CEM24109.1 unnamed protein product [Vitrella brassicaformis CCMP3155]
MMPSLIVTSTADLDKAAEDAFLTEASSAVASGLGKPESYMLVSYTRSNMRFGGSEGPVAFVYLASIGKIGPDTNPKVSATISGLVEKHLGVPSDRCYIQFVDSPGSNFGYRGGTF